MKRRICIFCETWENGGIEAFLSAVLQHMDLSNIEIDIVTTELKESIFSDQLKKAGVQFIELSGSRKQIVKNRSLFKKLLRKRQYDVLHANLFQGLSFGYISLAKRVGVQVRIAHSHNTGLRKAIGHTAKIIAHNISKTVLGNTATDYWACSKEAANFLFSAKIVMDEGYLVVPNGIETKRFSFCPEVRGHIRDELNLAEEIVVGNVGRLSDQKNQTFLLDIFSEFLKKQPNSVLLLVGSGEKRFELEKKANRLGIRSRVIFYGASRHVEELLWAMDVFVFPSRFEGLGIAVIEAQAAGLPVLCSDKIPQEAYILPSMENLPLSYSPNQWAECLYQMQDTVDNREKCVYEVQKRGFDSQDISIMIEQVYRGR